MMTASAPTPEVALSTDGKDFTEVGSHEFTLKKEERFTYTFPTKDARYVRLIYPDHFDEQAGFPQTFSFTTEVEVYAPVKGAAK